MSKIEDLIKQYCPDGVEYKKLGELGTFYGGITGKSKADFENGNAKFISYKNVYSNFVVDQSTSDRVMIGENENQRSLQYGDICFTGSSETPDECGFSSVVTSVPSEPLYLNSFSFFFRFHDLSGINPEYMKYLFRSSDLRYQIGKTANGVTRFNVSKELMKSVIIPIPHIAVQDEIVRILDKFTELEKELEKELELRRKQYEWYRDKLLTFDGGGRRKKVSEITNVLRGKRLTKTQLSEEGKFSVFHGGLEPLGKYDSFNRKANTVMIINVGASAGTVGYCKEDFWSSDGCFCLSATEEAEARYLYFVFQSNEHYLISRVRKAGIPTLDAKVIEDMEIPVPSLQEQERIVKILDKFDTLTTDLTSGLPAEIKLRHQQYEYYRDYLFGLLRLE